MEPPKCKLCGQKHYGTCFGELQERVYKLPSKPKAQPTPNSEPVKAGKHCATCRCFPMTAAQRQKAYRERRKNASGNQR